MYAISHEQARISEADPRAKQGWFVRGDCAAYVTASRRRERRRGESKVQSNTNSLIALCIGLAVLAGIAIAAILPATPFVQTDPMIPFVQTDPSADPDAKPGAPLRDLAREAGSRAAILAQCGIEPVGIDFAFRRKLEASAISQIARQDLWRSYEAARLSAGTVLAHYGKTGCEGAGALLWQTIRDLDEGGSAG
jgi:hypothetical protein